MWILLMAHSILRWVIIIVAIIAVIKFALGWLQAGKFSGMDRGLNAGYSGLMDLQATIGFIFFLWSGFAGAGFPLFRWVHLFVMALAVTLAHLPARWQKASDPLRFRNYLFSISASLAVVVIGVTLLPGGWSH